MLQVVIAIPKQSKHTEKFKLFFTKMGTNVTQVYVLCSHLLVESLVNILIRFIYFFLNNIILARIRQKKCIAVFLVYILILNDLRETCSGEARWGKKPHEKWKSVVGMTAGREGEAKQSSQ